MTEAPGLGGDGWTFEVVDGLLLVRCAALDAVAGIAHAFSTRCGDGDDGFDLGAADDRSERMRHRRSRFLAAAGIDGEAVILRQVHGARVIEVAASLDGPPEADGALWAGGGLVPSVRSADCVPILIADRAGRAAVAVHAGWRGTAAGIAGRAVTVLAERGVAPDSTIAAMGPAIGACCYEVGEEVVEALGGASNADRDDGTGPVEEAGRSRVDLREINRGQLLRAGLPGQAIHAAPWCTRCRADLFFSFRRDGEEAGRMMAAVGRRGRP